MEKKLSGQRQCYQLCFSEMIANFLAKDIKKIYIKPRGKKKGFSFCRPGVEFGTLA